MISMRLSEAADLLGGRLIGEDRQFDGVSTDTRSLHPGELFFALKGPRFDAHDLLDDALKKSATGAVSSKLGDGRLPIIKVLDSRAGLVHLAQNWRGRFELPVVGITGSAGKTSVKEMLGSVLEQNKKPLVTLGNFNNDIGVPKTLLNLTSNYEYAVIEMGMSNSGELTHLARIVCPDIAVITNIGTAHIGELGSQDAIAEAKSEIISGLPKDGVLIVEASGKYTDYLISKYSEGVVQKFGESDNADVLGEYVESAGLLTLKITHQASVIEVDLKIRGYHNVLNALAAAAVCFSLKISASSIKQGLESFGSVKGRLETIKLKSGDVLINDAYNANFDSVCRALECLAAEPGKKIFVFGDMGELDRSNARRRHVLSSRICPCEPA